MQMQTCFKPKIVTMKKFTLLLLSIVLAGMQLLQAQVQITGRVTNATDKTPVPGASVVVKGTTVGTITDFDGKFKLTVPSNATTLVF